jgi:nitroreductase
MDVYEAVASRRAVRSFTDDDVPRQVLDRVLGAAARSPSSGNMQPWHIYVVTGSALAELKRRTGERIATGDPGDEREFAMYPDAPKPTYQDRRSSTAEQRYRELGIAREDGSARGRAVAANWDCFGAKAALFCYIDREMGSPQWADLGMYLQTVMLLLRAEGLHSCPQMAWSVYRRTVAEFVLPPDGLVLFCGMSIGFEDIDDAAQHARTGRAALEETVTFIG